MVAGIVSLYMRALFAAQRWLFKVMGGEAFVSNINRRNRSIYYGKFDPLSIISTLVTLAIIYLLYYVLPFGRNMLLSLLSFLLFIVVLTLMGYDVNALEALFINYHSSSYYLSTGVSRRKVWFDKGLQGEFMAYVMSRELKIPHRVLYNVCVPMPNGNFQEIDAIIITPRIIYVMECKNRGGIFRGEWEEKEWVQNIGSQENKTQNIYIQNQKHTMAVDRLLLEKGIIRNGDSVCINTILRVGDMGFPDPAKAPLDVIFGDRKFLVKQMNKNDEKYFSDGTDTTGVMEQVYEALLPYALYDGNTREQMMAKRNDIARGTKEFSLTEFKERYIPEGIPGISDPGEGIWVRSNNVYTQIKVTQGGLSCWQTRTDIPGRYTGQ